MLFNIFFGSLFDKLIKFGLILLPGREVYRLLIHIPFGDTLKIAGLKLFWVNFSWRVKLFLIFLSYSVFLFEADQPIFSKQKTIFIGLRDLNLLKIVV